MKREMRIRTLFAGIAGVALVVWFLFPSSFVRGAMVGVVSTLSLLTGGLFFVGKRMKKRFGSELKPPPIPNEAWDYSLDLRDRAGAPVDCSQFSGSVVVLNFWATWCAPCVAEMPSLQGLREKTADLDVRFALVTREQTPDVHGFLEDREIDLPSYLLSGEPPECFKSRAIPATFILDRGGRIALRHFGAAKWDADAVVTFVRGLAATPAR